MGIMKIGLSGSATLPGVGRVSIDITTSATAVAARMVAKAALLEATLQYDIERLGDETAQVMRENCHFDRGYSTGATEASIASIPAGRLAVSVGPDTPQAVFVEHGTGSRGDDAIPHRANWAGMDPEPFVRPTFEQMKAVIPDFVRAELEGALAVP